MLWILHVKDTSAATLFFSICAILSHHGFDIQNLHGQGYDGTSNMRGEWKGLQTLFLNECPLCILCTLHGSSITVGFGYRC